MLSLRGISKVLLFFQLINFFVNSCHNYVFGFKVLPPVIVNNIQIRSRTAKHWNPKFKKLRGQKVKNLKIKDNLQLHYLNF